jgi:hypothetical protein
MLLVNIPDPAINYHGMVSMFLGLVVHYMRSVVVLLQEMKHMTMKRNKLNVQQLRRSLKQIHSYNG